jgi:hypothetical protein
MTVPACVVIDTNVWAIAEGMEPNASDQCVASCLGLLARVEAGLVIAIDTDGRVLNEYLGCLRSAKTAGLAVKLASRLSRTYRSGTGCKEVLITPLDDPPGSYEEVPANVRDFDPDDQKFLAVAAAEGSNPMVFAGLDSEWWERAEDLRLAGLNVQFPCAADLLALGG